MSLANDLTNRGFIQQFSAPTLQQIVEGEKRTIYHGIDPSANSAHVGNLVQWMLLKHLAQAGHKIVFLVGGGTGMIGDPKPDAERQLKEPELVAQNVVGIKDQAISFFSGCDIEFVNNNDWLSEIKLIDFLREIGKHYTVNELIKKDAIAKRLQSDNGLSYTEFAYPILQGFDYYQLFKTKNCTVQIGGSDQWGNIISGVELIRRKTQTEVYALTVPLVTDKATGKKFGKSEGNAVWLDAKQTSPYQFYQFWLNTSDESVIDYLKLFTFLSLEEVEQIKNDFSINQSNRSSQKTLAFKVTELIHGVQIAEAVQKVSEILFGEGGLENLNTIELEVLLNNAPTTKIDNTMDLIGVLVLTGLASSKREARTFIESGAISINNNKIIDLDYVIDIDNFGSDLALLRRGKKQLHIIKF